ncbi:probable BOI-related E3 ubiquitin-protein ligase 2 [Cucurbita pepo subsp. pepo]|uniref:probable BOI-related E3 ubiquitin-protein ligase 2 n=1 Tax=Cucurbita pepo subsp. pepo TaxID=3664 RepID=UPI000C9D9DA9|nr:probable BOI-related E3 ubiquitin-protein ligase 2 [Cucurbita pepo subsp. pepo]
MAVHAQLYSENHGFPFAGGLTDVVGQFCFQKPTQMTPTELFNGDGGDGGGSVFSFSKNPHRMGGGAAAFSQCMSAHVEKQRQEIDHCIRLQNERLRTALREQGKQQISTLMKKIEAKTEVLLRQKEEEIVKASKKTMELEIFLRKLETENQIWKRIAEENEAMAMSLTNKLDQMRENIATNSSDDAESCCADDDETPARNRACSVSEHGTKQSKTMMMICRGCNFRNSTVILLPCRHLCCCKHCESVLDSCPVCRTGKKASIEALIS